MRTALSLITAAICWGVLVYKLRVLRKDPANPFLRSFCIMTALIALTFTLAPPVVSWLEASTGVLAVWLTGVIVIGCGALQTTLLLWSYPPDRAWPKIHRSWVAYGLAFAAVVMLDAWGRIDPRAVDVGAYREHPMILYGATPYVAEATLIYAAVLAYTSVEAIRRFWHYAELVERRWLRRGLRVVAAGCALNLCMALDEVLFIAARRFEGRTLMPAEQAEIMLGSFGIMVTAVGTTLPVLGPRIDRFRSYRRLHPLWRALYRAVPQIALDPPTGRWHLHNLNHRLYRQVIEIRDGRLALRPYLDQQVAARAQQLARQAGLDGDQLKATVEAATLAAAIQAKTAGRPGALQQVEADIGGGEDLASELAWLTQVAKAFTDSPVVTAANPTPAGIPPNVKRPTNVH
jgi:hypothetical protein